MATLYHRTRSNANASLISMAQRFSDVVIIFWDYIWYVLLIQSHSNTNMPSCLYYRWSFSR